MTTTYVVDRKSRVAGVVRDVVEIGPDYALGKDSSVMGVDMNEAKFVTIGTFLDLKIGDPFPEAYEDISDSFRQISTKEQIDDMHTMIGALVLESAQDKAIISSLEGTVAALLFEVAALKGGAE
jgi:hypothetical protein